MESIWHDMVVIPKRESLSEDIETEVVRIGPGKTKKAAVIRNWKEQHGNSIRAARK